MMAVPSVGIYMPIYDVLLIELTGGGMGGSSSAEGGPSSPSPALMPAAYAPVVAGSVSRAVSCLCCAPLELMRTRIQVGGWVGG